MSMKHSVFFSRGLLPVALFTVTVCLLALVPGCSSESKETASSVTGRQRNEAPPEARRHLVTAYDQFEKGAFRTALAYTDSAAEVAPNLTDLHFLRGKIFTAVNKYDRANEEYRIVLDHDAVYQGAWLNMGNNSARQGRFRVALERYRKELENHSTATVWVSMGRAYSSLRKPDSARHAYRRALALDTAHAPAHMMLSHLFGQSGSPDSALHHARAALQLDPKNTSYRYRVGMLRMQRGQPAASVKLLSSVVDEQPSHAGAHYNLGMALQKLGRAAAAEQHLARADSLQQLQRRIRRLEKAAGANPKNALAWARLADALRRSGRTNKALEAYNVALSIAPKSVALQNNVANLALMQGNYRQALRRYRAILAQDSTRTDVRLNLGVVHAKMGNRQAARDAWTKVLARDPDHAAARKYLARYR